MPEGDTIFRAAAALRTRLVGKTVLSARPDAISRLAGRRVVAVNASGKHLLMDFTGGLTLHSHMRMTGSWHLYRPGERWRQPAHRATAVLTFGDAVAVLFAAPVLEILDDPARATGHLGPDILAPRFDRAAVLQRVRAVPPIPVGELLLDQRVCAGIGNIYKCEALWQLRIDPWLVADRLGDAEIGQLYRTARDMMRRSVSGQGFAPRPGVHARGGRPCPRCGTPVAVRPQGRQARLTYYCPECQRVPG